MATRQRLRALFVCMLLLSISLWLIFYFGTSLNIHGDKYPIVGPHWNTLMSLHNCWECATPDATCSPSCLCPERKQLHTQKEKGDIEPSSSVETKREAYVFTLSVKDARNRDSLIAMIQCLKVALYSLISSQPSRPIYISIVRQERFSATWKETLPHLSWILREYVAFLLLNTYHTTQVSWIFSSHK